MNTALQALWPEKRLADSALLLSLSLRYLLPFVAHGATESRRFSQYSFTKNSGIIPHLKGNATQSLTHIITTRYGIYLRAQIAQGCPQRPLQNRLPAWLSACLHGHCPQGLGRLCLCVQVRWSLSTKTVQCSSHHHPCVSVMPIYGSLLLILICAEEKFC